MGSMLHFFDVNHTNSSKKLATRRRQADGQEAPRNSLEFYTEASHNYNIIQEDIPYSCQVKQHTKMNFRSERTSINRLIDEEISKSINNKRYTTSIVARLMGMDDLPSQKSIINANKWEAEKPKRNLNKNGTTKLSSWHPSSSSLGSTSMNKATKKDFVPFDIKKEPMQSSDSLKLAKPIPREHPQEELLRKFKKDFAAWQKSMVRENSRTIEVNNCHQKSKINQIIAQENLNKEKMVRYMESRRYAKQTVLPQESYTNKQFSGIKSKEKQEISTSPTSIVILKPSVEICNDVEMSWLGSPEIIDNEINMKDFLEEVKERLKSEILGKAKINTISSDYENTKQFACHIAKQIRENVTNDLATSLIWSESTRSYRSEFQLNGPEFPEYISRETRMLLSDRLKNVIRSKTDMNIPLARITKERVKSRSLHDFSRLVEKPNNWEEKKPTNEFKVVKNKKKDAVFDITSTSRRNLVRSFSAPVSGTAFAKILLEDQQTGAHILRKRELSENSSPESRRKKKDGFTLKGTVSTLKQNFTLKGKLFGKKTHLVDQCSSVNELDSLEALVTTPSNVAKASSVHDNSTEVPPSPASVSSSSLDEFYRPGLPSPVSPLQANFIEYQYNAKDHTESPTIHTELSVIYPEQYSDLEPNDSSHHVEVGEIEVAPTEDNAFMDESDEIESHEQAYIREIIIKAGLFEDEEVFNNSFLKWDASKKLIPSWVFAQVEETCTNHEGDSNTSCKMLFDLTNEALPRVIKPIMNSTFKQWVLGPDKMTSRKKLLNDLWLHVQMYINHDTKESNSVDDMVIKDVKNDPRCTLLHEDLYITGKKIESVIFDELVDELISEILPWRDFV